MKKIYTLLFALSLAMKIAALLPNTDIWLLDIKTASDNISLSNPVNITNRNGYDNQPCISPDGKYLLYTSIREDKQSDIYKYNILSKKTSRITYSSTSEYSPTFIPGEKRISTVMVEKESTQRLWSVKLRNGKSSVLLKDIDSVGYHAWFENKALFLFLLPEPFKLYLVDRKTEEKFFINDSIGRCFKNYNDMLLYVKKSFDNRNQLWLYNLSGKKSWSTKTIIESEDFTLFGDYIIWAKGSEIYMSSIYNDKRKLVIDLASYNINNITRITIGPFKNKIAIVAESK